MKLEWLRKSFYWYKTIMFFNAPFVTHSDRHCKSSLIESGSHAKHWLSLCSQIRLPLSERNVIRAFWISPKSLIFALSSLNTQKSSYFESHILNLLRPHPKSGPESRQNRNRRAKTSLLPGSHCESLPDTYVRILVIPIFVIFTSSLRKKPSLAGGLSRNDELAGKIEYSDRKSSFK
jgi:hypothetical protein